MIQDKAQPAVNGYPLNKGCNAVLDYLWASLRARRETVNCGVASLAKGPPFPARRALHPKGTSIGAQLTVSRLADTYTLSVTPHLFVIQDDRTSRITRLCSNPAPNPWRMPGSMKEENHNG